MRPEGLDDRSTAESLFAAYGTVKGDPELFRENLQRITDPKSTTRPVAHRTRLERLSRFLLIYAEPQHRYKVRAALGELQEVPFAFEGHGSSILFSAR